MATTDIFSSFAQDDNGFMDTDNENESDDIHVENNGFDQVDLSQDNGNHEAMIEPDLMSVNLNGASEINDDNVSNDNHITQPDENVFDLFGDANDEPIQVNEEANKPPMDLFSKITDKVTEVTENQINKIKQTVNKVIEDDIAFNNNLKSETTPSLPMISAFEDDDENENPNENENGLETKPDTAVTNEANEGSDEMGLPQRRMPNRERNKMESNGKQTVPKYQSASNTMLPRKYTPQTRGRGRGRGRLRRTSAVTKNKLSEQVKIEKLNLEQISTIKKAVNRASDEAIESNMEPIPLTPNEKSVKAFQSEIDQNKFADMSRSASIEDVDINGNENEESENGKRKSIKVSTPTVQSAIMDESDSMPIRKKVIKKPAENTSKKYQQMSNDILPRKYKCNNQRGGRGRGRRGRMRPTKMNAFKVINDANNQKNDTKNVDLKEPNPTKETLRAMTTMKTRGNRPTRPPNRRGRGRGRDRDRPIQKSQSKRNGDKLKKVMLSATTTNDDEGSNKLTIQKERMGNEHSKESTNGTIQAQKKKIENNQPNNFAPPKQPSPEKIVKSVPSMPQSDANNEPILTKAEEKSRNSGVNKLGSNMQTIRTKMNEIVIDERKDYLLCKAKEYSRGFQKKINLGLVARYRKIQAKFEKKMKRLQKELEITKANNGALKRQIEELSLANSPQKNGKIQNEEKEQKVERVDVIIRTFEDFMLMCNAPYSSDIFDDTLLTNLRQKLEYNEPNNIMKQCLYPTIIQNKNLFVCSKSVSMQLDAISLCIVLKLFALINGADDQSDNIKILCLCPTRQKCTDLHCKISHLLHVREPSDVVKQRVDLIIPGQPQSKQHHTLHSRPCILITTPVLMTDFILAQHPIKDYVSCICHKNVQKLFNCIAVINVDQCLQSGFDQNIESILKQCNLPMTGKQNQNKYEHEKEQKMILSANNTSPAIEEFVEKLMPNNQDRYKLITSDDEKQQNEKIASDFLPYTNDYELDDKILLNTLHIQQRLKQKHKLISSLQKLLHQTEYKSILSTAEQLKDGSYHQTYNTKTSSNLTAKLNRMESKTKFMGAHSQQLIDNLNFKYLQNENERLQNELKESKNMALHLENDKESLTKALNLKISKIRQVEEEKGIVIGELRISLEEMSNNQTILKRQMTEEKDLLTQSLKEMVEKLSNENKHLREQLSHSHLNKGKLP